MILGQAGRFAGWPRWISPLLLAAVLSLAAFGAVTPTHAPQAQAVRSTHPQRDVDLYKGIAANVRAGQSYYAAAVSAQRAHHYPLRPFVTVRLPTLAWLVAFAGPSGASLILGALAFASFASLAFRLRKDGQSGVLWIAAATIGAAATILIAQPGMIWWHEAWAGLLIVLSLGARSRRHWMFSVAAGLLAALIREHAIVFVAVMAGCAAWERNWKEAAAWAGAIVLFALAIAGHAHEVAAYVTAQDPASPGWSSFGGWPFVLTIAQRSMLFALLPAALIAVAVPLALLGWACLRGETGQRVTAVLLVYLILFMLIGRPENFYWGLLIGPLLPVGLAFAPASLRDLIMPARPNLGA